jgi:DNA-binding SARP family transcriptional activator/ABC-type branched-subunit amino acid transport system substrate-binding protein
VEFRVLGPLEVLENGEKLPLGGPRQRLVLAYLLLEANRVVPTDRLIDRIWGDEPPEAARSALFAYVSRLKKLLGPTRIQARPPGYVLLSAPEALDALRFADLLDAARREASPVLRVALLADALALWRGDPLSDLADHGSLQAAISRLEELHLAALEEYADAQLEAGKHVEAVPGLESLVRDHPLRERPWVLLMLALYRSGRQGDALTSFHRARAVLSEELGIDPSPELRRLHERVLSQDPALDLPSVERSAPAEDRLGDEGSRTTAPSGPGRHRVAVSLTVIALGATVITAGLAWQMASAQRHLPAGTWTIGLDMHLSGDRNAHLGQLVRNAVVLAIDDLNGAGGIDGARLALVELDDMADADVAARNTSGFAANPTAIGLIGPWFSGLTFSVLPLTNAAGLLQCSPSATHPGLTKPRYGALDLRAAHPEAPNFIRLAPSDDIQSVALSAFAFHDLGASSVLVIDETGPSRPIADAFEIEYHKLGGITVRRTLNPGTDPSSVLAPLADAAHPTAVFFAGEADEAGALRGAMADGGWLSVPFLSWDALLHGSDVLMSGTGAGDYVERVGVDGADGSYAAHASVPDHTFTFAAAFRQRYGEEPDEYAAAGYACVQIIAGALRAIAPLGPSPDRLRDLVRAYALNPEHRYETVLGNIGFDPNGDTLEQFVTFYRFDATAASGAGTWVVFKKQDFGPAP